MDYAVNTYEFSPNQFYEMFLGIGCSMQFQTGNPTYVAGKNGCELVKEVTSEIRAVDSRTGR